MITFQIGQCGNQMGQQFFNFMYQEAMNASEAHQAILADQFFMQSEKDNSLRAKSVLIDMEPKVVNRCLQEQSEAKNNGWYYDESLSFCKQEGSGNNWAYGHNIHGEKCREDISQIIQTVIEKEDSCQGVLFMSSLAGGTGSGLGSYLLDLVDELYPELNKLNICVVPHLTGEVILQSYNCCLTIASLQQSSDGIILVENDTIEEICKKLIHLQRPTLDEMNRVIAHQLSGIFFPVLSETSKSVYSPLQNNFDYFSHIQDTLLQNPLYKLMRITNVPQMPDTSKSFSNDSWNALEKRVNQLLIHHHTEAQINWQIKPGSKNSLKQIANLYIARGPDSHKYDFQTHKDPASYYRQTPNYTFLKDTHSYNKNDRSISVLSNSQFVNKTLECVIERAHKMFQQRAYIYQYEKFGLTQQQFLESLAVCEQILQNYQNI